MRPKFIFAWDKQENPPCPTHLLSPGTHRKNRASRRVLLYRTAMYLRKTVAVKFPMERKLNSSGESRLRPLVLRKSCETQRGSSNQMLPRLRTEMCLGSRLHTAQTLRLFLLPFSFFSPPSFQNATQFPERSTCSLMKHVQGKQHPSDLWGLTMWASKSFGEDSVVEYGLI